MFFGCIKFNQPNTFDTRNVIATDYMFAYCEKFNQPIDFITDQVVNMQATFNECLQFNSKVRFSNTNKSIDMHGLFYKCRVFNQPLVLDTSSVTNMSCMFYGCIQFNQVMDIRMDNVKYTHNMFRNCRRLDRRLIHFSDQRKLSASTFGDWFSSSYLV